MDASVLRCPGCGAADTSLASAGGVHTCVYCGVRYRISQGAPQAVTPGVVRRGPGRVLVIGVLLGVAALAMIGYIARGPWMPAPAPVLPPVASWPVTVPPVAVPPVALPPVAVPPVALPPVSVAVPAEETAPATAEFSLETVQRSSANAVWIYGYLHNTSPFALGKTKITAVFHDGAGAEIGQGSGYTEDDVIPADARVPTVLLVSDPPATHERLSFEVHAERPSYLPAAVQGLELEAEPPRRDSFLGWKFVGKVHNRSGQPARFVKVDVYAFDGDDKLAGHAYTYASAEALADGATARFDGTLLDSRTAFKRFEFKVSGSPL